MPVSDNDRVQELCETASPVVGNPRETVKKKVLLENGSGKVIAKWAYATSEQTYCCVHSSSCAGFDSRSC